MARKEEINHLHTRLENKLDDIGYQRNERRRELVYRNIRNIVSRTMLTFSEVKTLEGVLSALIGTRKFGPEVIDQDDDTESK